MHEATCTHIYTHTLIYTHTTHTHIHAVIKNLAELSLCPNILWKTEFKSNELDILLKKVSKQDARGLWLLLKQVANVT